MMARAKSMPDAIPAEGAATWPELVTVPALIEFREGSGVLVQTYWTDCAETGAHLPVVEIQPVADNEPRGVPVLLSAPMLRGLLAALNAAEGELRGVGA